MTGLIIVTGATGTIGSETVKQLVDARAKVRAVARTKNNSWKIPSMGIELVEADLNNHDSLQNAFQGGEKLLLITPFSENMVELTKNAVHAAKNAGIQHIVRISAMGADPLSPMLALKLHGECENIIKQSGIPYTILRPNMFMQNFINMHGETIKTKNKIFAPAAKAAASFIDARDIALCAATILVHGGHEGQTYNLTGPEAIKHYNVEHILSAQLGLLIKYVELKPEEFNANLQGAPEFIRVSLAQLYEALRNGYMAEITNDVETITGKKPNNFQKFTKDNIQAFKKE